MNNEVVIPLFVDAVVCRTLGSRRDNNKNNSRSYESTCDLVLAASFVCHLVFAVSLWGGGGGDDSLRTSGFVMATASSQWWNNPVTDVSSQTSPALTTPGTIWMVTAYPAQEMALEADKQSLVVKPGIAVADMDSICPKEGNSDATLTHT
jgi:hypothetical protein